MRLAVVLIVKSPGSLLRHWRLVLFTEWRLAQDRHVADLAQRSSYGILYICADLSSGLIWRQFFLLIEFFLFGHDNNLPDYSLQTLDALKAHRVRRG
jgi:hypothetical protein